MKSLVPIALVVMLAACGPKHIEPRVKVETVTVKVLTPVPCPALKELGDEPLYPDTDEAIEVAQGIGPLAQLYRKGRLLRKQRLSEYIAARTACEALGE